MIQENIKNEKMKGYIFLQEMYEDVYYPNFLVDMGKEVLIELCLQIETQAPQNLEELYKLTHAATEKFNDLEEVFDKNDSEIETVARECIGRDFDFIAKAYNFEADGEELIFGRNW